VATAFRAREDFDGVPEEWDKVRRESQAAWEGLAGDELYLADPWPVLTKAHLVEYIA
jgi:hypothetical protein